MAFTNMRLVPTLLTLIALSSGLHAQLASPPPKKAPFAGFGNTSLDQKRPTGRGMTAPTTPSRPGAPAALPVAPTAPSAPATPASTTGGIALSRDWAAMVTQGSGGQGMKMDDLRALLSLFGTAEADVAAHPDVTIYEGPVLDGTQSRQCRITYLMPLGDAEKALAINRGMASGSRAVAPGFPDGLFLHTYDIRAGIYNRLIVVTDSAKPVRQVVCMLLKGESENWHPLHFKPIERDWHTYDYVNAMNRGQRGIAIHTRVNDLRGSGRFIVVNTAFGNPPPTGIGWVKVAYRPAETSTWYVPEPLIKLILFSLSKQLNR